MNVKICSGRHICCICGRKHKCRVTYGHLDQMKVGHCHGELYQICSRHDNELDRVKKYFEWYYSFQENPVIP